MKNPRSHFGSRDESLIRGTTLLISRWGRSLRTPASPIPVTGETVSHYWKPSFVYGTDSGTRPPNPPHRLAPNAGSLEHWDREDFSFNVFVMYTSDIKAQTRLFVNHLESKNVYRDTP